MKLYHVGSGIHGDLLKPNDKDIYVESENLVEYLALTRLLGSTKIMEFEPDIKELAVSRHGDLNIIIGLGMTVKQYTDGFDVNLVRGYKDLQSNKLILSKSAKDGLKRRRLEFLNRNPMHEVVLKAYDGTVDEVKTKESHSARIIKYINKLPEGFSFVVHAKK